MSKTGYFTHRDCWKHEMGPGHPECPERLDAIEDRLLVKLHDLRSGEWHRFTLAVHLQRWLRAASRGTLK